MKKILYYGILTAAILLLAGILIFTEPGLPMSNDGHDEATAGTDLFLLLMLPLEEDHTAEFEYLLDRLDFFISYSRLPEDITQGNPPESLEKFDLPAVVYEARDWVPDGAPLALTFNLDQTTPTYVCSDDLAALIEEKRDNCFFLWLPLKGFDTDAGRATFILDAGAVLAGLTRLDNRSENSDPVTTKDPDAAAYRVIILDAVPDLQDFNPIVGIYSGQGSWEENVEAMKNFFDNYGIEWHEFDEKDAVSLDLAEKFDLICFLGGISSEYHMAIQDQDNIREFVHSGGSYLGICAGAYYAVDMNLWDDRRVDYPLNFFPGYGIWPVAAEVGWGRKATIKLDQSHPLNSEIDLPSLYPEMFYFGGPYFSPYEDAENVEIIAWYDPYDRPSAVVSHFGEGKALLLGVHPELGFNPVHETVNIYGEEGAQWGWLYAALKWLVD